MTKKKIKKRFNQSIKCGTGEAFVLLKANPSIGFSKYIKKAALKNQAYDPQSEGDRANYVSWFIYNCKQKEQLINTVLKALLKERKDYWALDQLFDLAVIFAKNGNTKAQKKIYERYHEKLIYGDVNGTEAIVTLDGFDGLKFIAERRGKALIKDKGDWADSYLIDNFQEENPEIKAYKKLKKIAKENIYIKKYLDTIIENKRKRIKRPSTPEYTYEIIKQNIETKKILRPLFKVVKNLTEDDIRNLANDFLKASDIEKQKQYLRIFSEKKYPYDYQPILKIAKVKDYKDNSLVEYACEALRFFKGKDIRKLAIKKLAKTKEPTDYLHLLVNNYKKGDAKLITSLIKRIKNQHTLHDMVYGVIAIYRKNKTKECKKPLEWMYRKLRCGIHRTDLVEILHENKVMSKKILQEIEFDSYDETRKLFKKIRLSNRLYNSTK